MDIVKSIYPCHPERSNCFAEREAVAESKDLYSLPIACSAAGYTPDETNVLRAS